MDERNEINFDLLIRAYEELFIHNPSFNKGNPQRIHILKNMLGTPIPEAYYIIRSIYDSLSVEGSICEFGVAQGMTSMLIANEILALPKIKKLHLFDSFKGLPKPTVHDELKDDIFSLGNMDAYEGTMAYSRKLVEQKLESIKFPKQHLTIHAGFFDRILKLNNNLPEKISFAYLDFDLYDPILQSLNFFHTRSSKGSIIIVDDYDFLSTGCKKAVDQFIEANKAHYEFNVPAQVMGHFAVITKIN